LDINQKNAFGDNVVNVGSVDRALGPSEKEQILTRLRELGAGAVALHYEDEPETRRLTEQVFDVLQREGFQVNGFPHMQGGLWRNAIVIEPAGGSTAYVRIGSR
jgi:hypothetical protein